VIVVDTSVIVAAFASWHEQHEAADRAIADGVRLIAHCVVETFSVLTRLPPPHRAPPSLVWEFLRVRFSEPYITLDEAGYRALLPRLGEMGISGGAAYDALIAVTAAAAGASVISCDRRAAATYDRLGVAFQLLPA
jgi:predicted nucleic acid-binding protein